MRLTTKSRYGARAIFDLAYHSSGVPVQIYAVAAEKRGAVPATGPPAPALKTDDMKKAADAVDTSLTIVTPDDRDVKKLAGRIETSLTNRKTTEDERWQDRGYWFLPLLTVLGLFFFRKGWIVTYSGTV